MFELRASAARMLQSSFHGRIHSVPRLECAGAQLNTVSVGPWVPPRAKGDRDSFVTDLEHLELVRAARGLERDLVTFDFAD